MEGKEVGLPRPNKQSLREQAARTVLRYVRARGHPYIDLRTDNKAFVYFCTLCLSPCYSDTVLFDHLNGNLHRKRLAAAKLTLLRPNPWPFNDGVVFFDTSAEDGNVLENKENSPRLLEFQTSESLAIVEYGKETEHTLDDEKEQSSYGHDVSDAALDDPGENYNFLIPNVILKSEISDLLVTFVGVGKIAARYLEKDDTTSSICRIWCEWLGKQNLDDDSVEVPKHDFAIVTMSYHYELGRRGVLDELTALLTSSSAPDPENEDGPNKKRKKSFSDPEDVSESLSRQYDSAGEEAGPSKYSSSKLMRSDDPILRTGLTSNRSIRKELRKQEVIASEKLCDICQQRMLPGKDVATLVNLKTGRLACSSRNSNGAFHVYHVSCLIHWILLCEFEIARSPPPSPPQPKGRPRKKNGAKGIGAGKNDEQPQQGTNVAKFESVFCPECQGTGISTDGDSKERDKFSLSQMFYIKIKICKARETWMKSPEALENCSVGLNFPPDSEDNTPPTEKVSPLRMLNFYSAIDRGCPSNAP